MKSIDNRKTLNWHCPGFRLFLTSIFLPMSQNVRVECDVKETVSQLDHQSQTSEKLSILESKNAHEKVVVNIRGLFALR